MTRAPLATVVALAAALAGAPANADEFTPGHVFVGGQNGTATGIVVELDADLNHVRDILLPDPPEGNGVSQIYGVAFGPDGMLYAAQVRDGRVERVAPDGSFTSFVADGEGLDGASLLSFDPVGRLVAGSRGTDELLRRELGGGLTALTLPAAIVFPDVMAFLPSGRRVVSHYGGDAAARVVDAYGRASLQLDQTELVAGYPANTVELRDGSILVPDYSGERVLVTHPDGRDSVALTHPDLDGPFGIAVLRNGNVLVSGWDGDTLVELMTDGTYVRTITHTELRAPAQIAVAPHVFDTQVTGSVADADSPQKKVKGQGLRLLVELNGGEVLLSVPETPDLYPVSGAWALRGHVSRRAGDARIRMLHASMPGDHHEEGRGEIVLEIQGREDESGRFQPKKVKGTWHFSRDETTFAGTIRGKVPK